MQDGLFGKGWRDPTDDGERAAVYFMMAVAVLAGPFLLWGAFQLFFRDVPDFPDKTSTTVLGVLCLILGLALPGGALYFLKSESKYWQLKKMTADRFIAGGMLLAIGLVWLGFEVQRPVYVQHNDGGSLVASLALFLAGGGLFLLFLLVGLVFALWPTRTRRWTNAVVVERFAMDDKYMEIPDAPPPLEEDWSAVVVVRTPDGEKRQLAATHSAYEMAYVGAMGTAKVKGQRLIGFEPRLKEAASATR